MNTNKKFISFILISALMLSLFLFASNTEAKPKGSQIAGQPIEDKTDGEIQGILEEHIQTWQAGDPIIVTSEYERFELPRTAFTFDIQGTIDAFNDKTKRTFSSFFLKPKNVHIPLHVQLNHANEAVEDMEQRKYMDTKALFNEAQSIASVLGNDIVPITYVDENDIPFESISETTIDLDEVTNATLKQSLKDLDGVKIKANDSFSFIQQILFDASLSGANEEASYIAGNMYQLFLHTNFQIAERSIHARAPSHSQPGFDVQIDVKENKDFIVVNPNDLSFIFSVETSGNELTLALTSAHHNESYDVELEEKEIDPRIVYRYDDKLEAEEEEIIQQGVAGTSVIVERLTYNDERDLRETDFISHDIYTFVPTIILVSYKDEETIQEETIEEQVDALDETITNFESQLDAIREEAAANSASSEMIASLAEQLVNIQSQQADFMQLITALQEQISASEGPDEYYKNLEERLTAIDEQLETLEETIGGF